MPDNAADKQYVLVGLAAVTDMPYFQDFAGLRPHPLTGWAKRPFRDCGTRRGRSRCIFQAGP